MNTRGCSNGLLIGANIIALIVSILTLATGLVMISASIQCENKLQVNAMLTIAVISLVTSVLGLVGSCCGIRPFLWIYLTILIMVIVVLFYFTIFAFIVSSKGLGDSIPGKKYKEYRLGGYHHWLEDKVKSTASWQIFKKCLQVGQACASFTKKYANYTEQRFYGLKLSSIESGCCKPSNDCGFGYIHPSEWNKSSGSEFKNADCVEWSNSPNVLCFNCNSCKAGFVDDMKRSWKQGAKANIGFILFLIPIIVVGFFAVKKVDY